MIWLVLAQLDPEKLPESVNGYFAAFIIMGIIGAFLYFLTKMFKIWLENTKKVKKEESDESFNKAFGVYEKLNKIIEGYAGRFASKEEFEKLEEKVNKTREDLSKIKGQIEK